MDKYKAYFLFLTVISSFVVGCGSFPPEGSYESTNAKYDFLSYETLVGGIELPAGVYGRHHDFNEDVVLVGIRRNLAESFLLDQNKKKIPLCRGLLDCRFEGNQVFCFLDRNCDVFYLKYCFRMAKAVGRNNVYIVYEVDGKRGSMFYGEVPVTFCKKSDVAGSAKSITITCDNRIPGIIDQDISAMDMASLHKDLYGFIKRQLNQEEVVFCVEAKLGTRLDSVLKIISVFEMMQLSDRVFIDVSMLDQE